MIAVHAQHLKSVRIASVSKPLVKLVAAHRSDLFAMVAAIVLDVVKTQDKRLINSAPRTSVSTIGLNGCMLEPIIVGESILSATIRVVLDPLIHFRDDRVAIL
ncbi:MULTISPECIES: hypothetical protein [unclassified Bradyrhizobium]|uniref:hypothetical protein n=1 Tax=unclassified Bradyrhizobium TaxID=2631580 RepID=UPI002916E480|nr:MULTISPECIES: hypothetical protein [unclassified Bradyrhizobium]